jgi:hypothetical protein
MADDRWTVVTPLIDAGSYRARVISAWWRGPRLRLASEVIGGPWDGYWIIDEVSADDEFRELRHAAHMRRSDGQREIPAYLIGCVVYVTVANYVSFNRYWYASPEDW